MITGNEFVYATADNGTEFATTWEGQRGLTIRQLALKDFMCALIQCKDPLQDHNYSYCAMVADEYVEAYINKLNQQSSR